MDVKKAELVLIITADGAIVVAKDRDGKCGRTGLAQAQKLLADRQAEVIQRRQREKREERP